MERYAQDLDPTVLTLANNYQASIKKKARRHNPCRLSSKMQAHLVKARYAQSLDSAVLSLAKRVSNDNLTCKFDQFGKLCSSPANIFFMLKPCKTTRF
ncbi:MAG: hypothetical protein K5751_08070 [Treponemataceae bacterium]|nr:hypothetical protein [Treponemataceae bacterium]